MSTPDLDRWVEWADPHPTDEFPWNDDYVELYWLPTMGPSCTWMYRRLCQWLTAATLAGHSGTQVDLEELGGVLGLRPDSMRHTLARLVGMGMATEQWPQLYVRRQVPRLRAGHLDRLPDNLRALHEREHGRRVVTA